MEMRQSSPGQDVASNSGPDAAYANKVLALLSATVIISSLSNGLLNISLPVVVRHFNASATESSWLLLGAMLTNTSLIIMFGRLADMFGRVPIYWAGLITMTVTSFAAGFSPNVDVLIVIRMVQAAGTAMLLANMAAMLTVTTPPDKLSRAMGFYMSALSSSSLAGPPLGAMLAETVGWRWLFWFQAPFALILVIWSKVLLRPMPPQGQRGRLDVPGVFLVATILTAMLLALSTLQTASLTSPVVLIGIAVFVVGLPVFVIVENRTASPLVDLRLFKRASVAASNGAMFFGNMARFAVVLIVGLYFQAVEGDTALVAAFKVLPLPLATTLAGLIMGRISNWASQRTIATIAAAVSGSGVVILLLAFGANLSYPAICLGLMVCGFGGGVFMPANTTAILQEVPRERLGVVNAVRMMLMSSGSLMATGLALAVVTSTLPHELRSAVFAGTVSEVAGDFVGVLRDGYVRAFLVLILLVLVGVVCCIISQRAYARSGAAAGSVDAESAKAESTESADSAKGADVAESNPRDSVAETVAEDVASVSSVEAFEAVEEARDPSTNRPAR